jgi:ABC-2 type transport system permease protein
LHLRRWWWSKFWVALIPLLFFGELLAIVTNYFLGVSTFMMILAPVTLGLLTFALVAVGMAFGIAYPNFTAEHVAKIPASFGGVLYMAFSIVFIGLIVVLEAWPVHLFLVRNFQRVPLSTGDWNSIILSFATALSLTVILFWGAMRWSITRLEEMEISL